MAYESDAEPIKLGYLFDFVLPDGFPKEMRADLTQSFELVFEEGLAQGIIDRPIEIVFREVEGLPKGSVKAVIDAYGELVDEGCLAVFGPAITDNCIPTKEAIEKRFQVPAISVTGTDDWLGEWTFSLSMGSMTDEPVFWAHLLAKRNLDNVGVLVEQSLVGETYIRSFRAACRDAGIRIAAEEPIAQTAQDIGDAVRKLHSAGVGALVHCGFGFGVVLINPVLRELAWDPPRFMGTAFQNAWINPIVWEAMVGWTGLDQYDEGNELGQQFIDRYAARYGWRPEYCVPVVNRDLATVLLHAFADARSLSPRGVKEALERIRLLPAASGSPGTRISYGKWSHRGWMGAGYLVARRLDPDGTTAHLVERFGQDLTAMATDVSELITEPAPPPVKARRRIVGGVTLTALLVALIVVGVNARRGAVTERIKNPAVSGAPRPVQPLWGFTHWLGLLQVGTVVTMAILIVAFVVAWRRHPRHPILLMALVMTLLVWQDPIMNWAPYAVYNPQLWHWPASWGLESMSPTVEPFIVIGYATFYMAPFFPAIWILRRLQARRPAESFVWRHPLVSLSVLIYAIGFVFDTMLEMFCIRTQLYIYSQVVPFGSFAVGKWYQFPLIWEASLVTLVMIPAGVLLYRDDTGRTQAEKLALRIRAFRARPALGTFVVMFAIINVAYFCYGAGFAILHDTKAATSVACPWPFPEAKVYDPNGFYEAKGQTGPYSSGIWSGWESGQPNGRPSTSLPATGDQCGGGHHG